MPAYDLVVITGPTASGKTSLAVAVAAATGGEIISADSRQVYRGMDLGTGKDYDDYRAGGRRIPFHLIDIADPGYKYNVFEYQRDFIRIYDDMISRRVFPVVCGGSGMYIDSIVSGYRMFEVPPDPYLRSELEEKTMDELISILSGYKKMHNVTDIDTKKRAIRAIEIEEFHRLRAERQNDFPRLRSLLIGLKTDREIRRQRITERLRKRLEAGMVDEVKKLLDEGVDEDVLIYYGLEYKYITLYLKGMLSYDAMVKDLETAIHQFAKRQMTWFRGMERRGVLINWIDGELPMETKVELIIGGLNLKP
ncbi:MAG: tRNA (adenosine(37)-N6)-dimethylallyltransferase MiaA [Bacteroidales bacterium]|nr:tRNA (adenosine(37)-N6)-dimethylallyltransferase MiaA [Bacteroidales bacterium]